MISLETFLDFMETGFYTQDVLLGASFLSIIILVIIFLIEIILFHGIKKKIKKIDRSLLRNTHSEYLRYVWFCWLFIILGVLFILFPKFNVEFLVFKKPFIREVYGGILLILMGFFLQLKYYFSTFLEILQQKMLLEKKSHDVS